MNFSFTTEPATFIQRPNRFRVEAKLKSTGEIIQSHCPDPGRLKELLLPDVTVHVSKAQNKERKTPYDLRFVEHPAHGQLISLDTRLPNQLFAEGLEQGFFVPFQEYDSVKREVSLGKIGEQVEAKAKGKKRVQSRIDFRLTNGQGQVCWVEVKSATLVENREAIFPDAPTIRGQRHLHELIERVKAGDEAAVVFIIQRPDADLLRPNWVTDPDFSQTLLAAKASGVAIYAYTCALSVSEIVLERVVPVVLEPYIDS